MLVSVNKLWDSYGKAQQFVKSQGNCGITRELAFLGTRLNVTKVRKWPLQWDFRGHRLETISSSNFGNFWGRTMQSEKVGGKCCESAKSKIPLLCAWFRKKASSSWFLQFGQTLKEEVFILLDKCRRMNWKPLRVLCSQWILCPSVCLHKPTSLWSESGAEGKLALHPE